tara:strand:- start:88133 stop:89152 length:1020 start_codon:yes stop_codon:yes gene_type:complete
MTMTPYLLNMLCDPEDQSRLSIKHPRYDENGNITAGILESKNGNTYPVRHGIPRFTGERARVRTSVSHAEQHSDFHQNLYRESWLNEYVKETFTTPNAFIGKNVIDCGGGTGYQSKWMIEHGAKHVIVLENSHHVDGVARECMEECECIDIVQCSLEALPFRKNGFSGLITCNDVLQHTESFDNSLKSLWDILNDNGEIVISCPVRQSQYWYQKMRYKAVNQGLRNFLSTRSVYLAEMYSRVAAFLYLIPLCGYILRKNNLVHRSTKPGGYFCLRRRYKDAFHRTFEYFAGHKYEHMKTPIELKQLINHLQRNPCYVLNTETFFQKDRPLGVAIRLKKK